MENLKKNFSKFIGCKYCVGVNSGTDALIIALRALKVGKNDEVIVPALSASATAIAVKNVGAKIVYADLDINTYNITAKTVKSKKYQKKKLKL